MCVFGRFQQIELAPIISIRAPPDRRNQTPGPIELMQSAGTPYLQKMCLEGNDSQNSRKVSGSEIPLEVQLLPAEPNLPQTEAEIDQQFKDA
jgi:hypothetical protein